MLWNNFFSRTFFVWFGTLFAHDLTPRTKTTTTKLLLGPLCIPRGQKTTQHKCFFLYCRQWNFPSIIGYRNELISVARPRSWISMQQLILLYFVAKLIEKEYFIIGTILEVWDPDKWFFMHGNTLHDKMYSRKEIFVNLSILADISCRYKDNRKIGYFHAYSKGPSICPFSSKLSVKFNSKIKIFLWKWDWRYIQTKRFERSNRAP